MWEQCGHGKVSVEGGAHAGCIVRCEVLMTVAMKILPSGMGCFAAW